MASAKIRRMGIACTVFRENYQPKCWTRKELSCVQMLIRGATRLDPWVVANCKHLSIEECDRDGRSFEGVGRFCG